MLCNLPLNDVWIKKMKKISKRGRTGWCTWIHSLDLFIWSEWNLACDDNCYFLFFVSIRAQIPKRREHISVAQLPPDLPTSLRKQGSSDLTQAALICCCDISNRRESSSCNLTVAFLLLAAILPQRRMISVPRPDELDFSCCVFFFFFKSWVITGQKHTNPQSLSLMWLKQEGLFASHLVNHQ